MARRRMLRRRGSRKLFSRTANRSQKLNRLRDRVMRGGFRL